MQIPASNVPRLRYGEEVGNESHIRTKVGGISHYDTMERRFLCIFAVGMIGIPLWGSRLCIIMQGAILGQLAGTTRAGLG